MNTHSKSIAIVPLRAAARRRQSGTAMLETVLVLPLIFVILGLVFWFGNAFEKEQQQRILARYDVARVSNMATPLAPETPAGLDGQRGAMTELYFDNRAEIVSVDWDGYASPAAGYLAGIAANQSTPTGDLASRIFGGARHGTKIKLLVEQEHNGSILEAVSGPLRRRSVHPGPSWAYADAMRQENESPRVANPPLTANWVYHRHGGYLRADSRVRDVFYPDFDRQLSDFPEPATRMVSLIRGMLYAHQPGYGGPTVNFSR